MFHLLKHIRQSLSTKLSLGILLFAVPIFVVSVGTLFLQSRNIVRKEATQRATSALNTTMQRLSRYLQVVETATNVTEWQILENMHPDSLQAYSHRIILLNPDIDGCGISLEPDYFSQYGRYFSVYTFRKDGKVLTNKEPKYEYFDENWYKTVRTEKKPIWTDFYDDSDSLVLTLDGLIASFNKPLYDSNQQFIGVISSDLSLRRLSKTITKEKPFPNSYFMMIGKEGHYFIHPDTTRLFSHTIFHDGEKQAQADMIVLGHKMTDGQEGYMQAVIDGQSCLVCYQPVANTHWSLALVCPEYDIFQGIYRLTYFIAPLIIIGLLLILLLCQKAVAYTIKPVRQLVVQSLRIAEGSYDTPIPHSHRQDSVGQLQNSFAMMQASLEKHVNDIRQANIETAQRNEELQKASLMVEESARQKTAFIQNMTHQIRTPLNIIMGFAQVLRDSLRQLPIDEMKEIAKTMNRHAAILSRIVTMLYDSSETGLNIELNSKEYEDVSCNQLAHEAIDHTHQHFPDIPILFETSLPDTFCIHTNYLNLMRSLREILYNSAKYSDGKNVSLRIDKTDTSVRFVFEDTGLGISEEYRELMYIPFTKSNDLSEGLGLGLALVKRHIVNLGGELSLDTDYQKGTRFIIEMPL